MRLHPILLSTLFVDAVRGPQAARGLVDSLGPLVLVGHLPREVTVQPGAVTALALVRNPASLQAAGLSMDMVAWPLRKSGLERLLGAGIRVGRDPGNDLVLPGVGVSKRHAVLHVQDGQARVEDVGSANRTLVNGVPVALGVAVPVKDGDRVNLGGVELVVMATARLLQALTGGPPAA